MTDPAYLTAQFTQSRDTTTSELVLTLDNHLEDVWAALTDSARLPQWLAPGQIELFVGGAAKLDFVDSGGVIDSKVSAVEPRRLLEYSWSCPGEPLRPVRWDLEPIGPTTRLALKLTVPADEDAARATAGWAAHLEMLTAYLAGAPTKFPFAVFKAARDAYRDQLAAGQAHRQLSGAEH
jgi:uncharacterized protein YndB with AHSA1/START domain